MKTKQKIGTFIMGLTLACSLNANAGVIENDLGRGVLSYDLKAGLKDRCIEVGDKEFATSDVRKTNYTMELVKSKEELYDKITTSSSGDGSYFSFNASSKVNFMKEKKWNYNSVYIWIKTSRITNKVKITKDDILLRNYSRNLAMDSKFVFSEACGDKVITEIEMGGELHGILEVVTDSYQEKQSLEIAIEGSGSFGAGKAKGSSDYKREIQKLKEKYTVKISLLHIGGSIIQVPQTEEELLKITSNIEALTDSHPVPVGSITRNYSTISNYPLDPNSPEIKDRQSYVDTAEEKLKEARTLFANGLYVLANPNDFRMLGFDKNLLQEELDQLESYIWKLKEFKNSAYSFLNEVNDEILIDMPKVKLPKRKIFDRNKPLNVTCETKESSICGVKTYKEKDSAYCGVASPKTGTGPVCGTLYREGRGPECGIESYKVDRSAACGVELYRQCHSSSCGKNWDGSRKRCRSSSCGVERYKACSDKEHGVQQYNQCRNANFGVDKYETCASPEFGYNFNICEHFSHGPDQYDSCNVATIGKKETYCPDL